MQTYKLIMEWPDGHGFTVTKQLTNRCATETQKKLYKDIHSKDQNDIPFMRSILTNVNSVKIGRPLCA
jgi:hypothetical protein